MCVAEGEDWGEKGKQDAARVWPPLPEPSLGKARSNPSSSNPLKVLMRGDGPLHQGEKLPR